MFVGLPEITLKLSWCIGIALSVYQGGGPGPWVLWAHMLSSLCTWGSRTWGLGFSGKADETGDVAATQGVGFAEEYISRNTFPPADRTATFVCCTAILFCCTAIFFCCNAAVSPEVNFTRQQ